MEAIAIFHITFGAHVNIIFYTSRSILAINSIICPIMGNIIWYPLDTLFVCVFPLLVKPPPPNNNTHDECFLVTPLPSSSLPIMLTIEPITPR